MNEPTNPTSPTRYRGFLGHTSRAVYGTIVATAVIAAEANALTDWGPWHFFGTLWVTLVVLWFSEIYSDVLGDTTDLPLGGRIKVAAGEHLAVLEAGVPLGIPLLLGGLGVIGEEAAVWATLLVSVVALGVWGGIASANRGRPRSRVVLAVVASALIGVIIILLKQIK